MDDCSSEHLHLTEMRNTAHMVIIVFSCFLSITTFYNSSISSDIVESITIT